MRNELVSAVIPCHNYGQYLPAAVQSLREQIHQNLEIIVVNDGSTDDVTLIYLDKLGREGIHVINSPQVYPAAARNIGVAQATGDYILTLDADDLFEKSFVQKALTVLSMQPSVGAVSSWTVGFGYSDFLWKPPGGSLTNFLMQINCSMSALIRKNIWQAVGGCDSSLTIGYEDWDFWIRLTKNGWLVHIIPEPLFYYRQKQKSRVKAATNAHSLIHYQLMKKHPDVYQTIFPHLFSS